MKKIYIVLICISLSLLIGLGVAAALVHIDKTDVGLQYIYYKVGKMIKLD